MGRKRRIVRKSDIQSFDSFFDVFSRGRRVTKRVRQLYISVFKGRVEVSETLTTIEPCGDPNARN
jgi:hypothetical protein